MKLLIPLLAFFGLSACAHSFNEMHTTCEVEHAYFPDMVSCLNKQIVDAGWAPRGQGDLGRYMTYANAAADKVRGGEISNTDAIVMAGEFRQRYGYSGSYGVSSSVNYFVGLHNGLANYDNATNYRLTDTVPSYYGGGAASVQFYGYENYDHIPPTYGSSYDWQSGNTYNWYKDSLGNTNLQGFNYNTGSIWSTDIDKYGNMNGFDSNYNYWNYNSSTGSYYNSDGTTCYGKGIYRHCY